MSGEVKLTMLEQWAILTHMIRFNATKPSLPLKSSLLLMTATGLIACAAPNTATGNPTSLTETNAVPAIQNPITPAPLESDDLDGRMMALENRVSTLETDMTSAKPILRKVEVIERQFKSLSLELDRIDTETSSAVPSAPQTKTEPVKTEKETIKPTKTEPKAAPPKMVKGAPAVTNLRFGSKNKSSTRIVIDANHAVKITPDLDNEEKILVLDIKGLDWKTSMNKTVLDTPLISSYSAQKTETGSRLVLQLKQAVSISKPQSLNPEKDMGHRGFIDLNAQ